MGVRQWCACNATPLLLRLSVAATFLWAGYGKLAYNDPMSGDDAATLANLGVITGPSTLTAPKEAEPTRTAPTDPEPPAPETPPKEEPATPSVRGGEPTLPIVALVALADEQPTEVIAPATTAPQRPAYVAADFPNAVMVPRLYRIALILHAAAHPADPAKQLWPAQLSEPRTIRTLAWIAAITEVAGGAMILFGFLTRLAAMALAGNMVVAMVLTTIGPAALSGDGFLGFLPQPRMAEPDAWGPAWTGMLFQFALLMMSMGLVLSGSGGLSLDRLIFGPTRPQSTKVVASKTA